jgi:hypothetical protein
MSLITLLMSVDQLTLELVLGRRSQPCLWKTSSQASLSSISLECALEQKLEAV